MSSIDPVYVVTRGSRRVEPQNYTSKELASKRALSLIDMIQKWDKPSLSQNSIKIVKTTKPHTIK